jgi:hypothetical protein
MMAKGYTNQVSPVRRCVFKAYHGNLRHLFRWKPYRVYMATQSAMAVGVSVLRTRGCLGKQELQIVLIGTIGFCGNARLQL